METEEEKEIRLAERTARLIYQDYGISISLDLIRKVESFNAKSSREMIKEIINILIQSL